LVDQVYKKQLPELRGALEQLREDFSNLGSKTDWTKLRIEPLLSHIESLEQVLGSERVRERIFAIEKRSGALSFRPGVLSNECSGTERASSVREKIVNARNKMSVGITSILGRTQLFRRVQNYKHLFI
jgi:hypothetical protein